MNPITDHKEYHRLFVTNLTIGVEKKSFVSYEDKQHTIVTRLGSPIATW